MGRTENAYSAGTVSEAVHYFMAQGLECEAALEQADEIFGGEDNDAKAALVQKLHEARKAGKGVRAGRKPSSETQAALQSLGLVERFNALTDNTTRIQWLDFARSFAKMPKASQEEMKRAGIASQF